MPVTKRSSRPISKSSPRTSSHSISRPAPGRIPRRPARRNTRLSLVLRLALLSAGSLTALLVWAILARALAPRANTNRQTFDAIIVLGTTADADGNPTPELLDRVTEAVHEYQRGVAPRLIVTGAAAHNRFVEADVMARIAEAQGVPASQIIEEPRALDTIQNACYSNRILGSHGWHSAEVVTSAAHLPRAAMIFSHLDVNRMDWRMHVAPANLTPGSYSTAAIVVETLKTARYLVWARWVESC